ncbi:MAG: RNA methyltransferase PUA domain-containing protein, partial [Steroidobacteraceae bacterium]
MGDERKGLEPDQGKNCEAKNHQSRVGRQPFGPLTELRCQGTGCLPELATGHLSAEESHHAVHVLRLRPGDSAAVFDGRGTEARVRLTSTDPERVGFETLSTAKSPRPPCRIR